MPCLFCCVLSGICLFLSFLSLFNLIQVAAYPRSERSLPTPPAFAINNLPAEINFPMQQQHDMIVEEYPERPGEPDCSFFLKTGDCKFKFNCKFNHPKNRNIRAKANSFTLNDEGLPLRPVSYFQHS